VVVGPKDLPRMLRTFGKTTAKLRAMAGDFQKQFNEALKEAELDDVKKSVDELRSLNPASQLRKQLNPFEKAAADVRSGLDQALKPSKPPEPAATEAQPAEPLKNGATAMPGVAGPETMPAAPIMTPLNGAATARAPVSEALPVPSSAPATAVPQPPASSAPGAATPDHAAGLVGVAAPSEPAPGPRKRSAAKPAAKAASAAKSPASANGKAPARKAAAAKPKVVAAKTTPIAKSAAPKRMRKPKADAE
jgi:sec-independent protein translocase protein TatB